MLKWILKKYPVLCPIFGGHLWDYDRYYKEILEQNKKFELHCLKCELTIPKEDTNSYE